LMISCNASRFCTLVAWATCKLKGIATVLATAYFTLRDPATFLGG
jgi:hypothetical protein